VDLALHWRGHFLLFDVPARAPSYSAGAGLRLIAAFLLLEAVIGPRFHVLDFLGLPQLQPWLRVLSLVGLALVLVRLFAGVKLRDIGLIAWRDWSAAGKSYFIQVAVIANLVFALAVSRVDAHPAAASIAVSATNFLWGFYQELAYRGMLQTELTRRFGAVAGVLLANVAYTFSPLHYYHFAGSSPIVMFATIFAIGLYFGALRHRSGNLWMPAVFHGIGTAWILGA
jgi:membrane protease YdiL (CAAX protease family)